jgi:hypothetical protein
MALLKDFAVSGEYVENLDDKKATIIKVPHYENFPDLDNEGQVKEKLVMDIELSDGSQMSYYPNKSSTKNLGNAWGVNLDKWLMKKFEFEVMAQKVRGENKKVLYAKALKNEGKDKTQKK